MAILSLDRELDTDFLAGFDFEDQRLPILLMQAQAIAESPMGCDRPLEITPHTELKPVPSSGFIYLSKLPVVGALTQVQIRGGDFARFNRTTSIQDWETLEVGQFELDAITGEVRLKVLEWLQYSFQGAARRSKRYRPTQPYDAPQIRVAYNTGFNFDVLNADTQLIKTVVAAIAFLYTQSNNLLYPSKAEDGSANTPGTIQRVRVEDVVKYEVEYAANVQANLISAATQNAVSAYQSSQLGDLLKLLGKYRTRGRSV